MCGIAGLVHLDPRGLADAGEVARMTRTLVHRGPDGEGVWTKGAVGFGHRRLAILDLSEAGAQPMADGQGEITVTYNGEVYNWRDLRRELEGLGHSFHTECDTEVLVEGWRAWGVGLLDRLEGMYAFAVHDGRTGQVLLARDRLGIKPLYWAEVDGTVLFASEVRALLASGRLTAAPDRERVDAFLTLGYVPGERTFFEGIRKLRPGHALLVEGGAVRTWRTWDPARIQPVELPYAEARAELDRRFTATLERHLMSDVPLGCFLSGGVDSSGVVAWLARRLGREVQTFTVGYPEDRSELGHAARVAEAFGTRHRALELDHEDFLAGIDRQVEHAEEPLVESAGVALLELSRFASEHATVLLSGEGADEAFAGYPLYARNLTLDRLRTALLPLRTEPFRALARLGLRGERWTKYLDWLAVPTPERHQGNSCDVTPTLRRAMYAGGEAEGAFVQRHFAELFARSEGQDLVARMQAADLETWLADDLLLKADKMTMAASIELRVPFLDHGLVEFGLGLPREFKVQGGVGKRILKDLFSELVPRDLLYRTKQGFPVPVSRWFREGLRDRVEGLLTSERCLDRGYLRPEYVRGVLQRHASGREDLGRRLFALVVLELWHRRWIDGETHPARALSA